MKNQTLRQTNPLIVGRCTRFTVIHPNCIRIESNATGKFIDHPSLFAIHRDARCTDFQVTEAGNEIVIDTGAIRLHYRPDGRAVGPRNLSAQIRHGSQWVNWRPGQRNRANLGGTAETLDGWVGARALEPGLLSRDGWFLLDDSVSAAKVVIGTCSVTATTIAQPFRRSPQSPVKCRSRDGMSSAPGIPGIGPIPPTISGRL